MQHLAEFEDAIESERRKNPEGPEADEVMALLQKAAREILTKQVLHSDAHHKTPYTLLWRHRTYFERLFSALGYELRYDSAFEYVLLLPGEIGTGSRRGNINKEETLLLFALRVIWEEGSREGDMDDFGRIEIDSQMLADRYTALAATEAPKKAQVKRLLEGWRTRGLVRMGEEDREEEVFPIVIMPVIREIVTEQVAREVEDFLASPGAKDVFEHIEELRAAPAADETEQAEETLDV
jgi:hypothetical protein